MRPETFQEAATVVRLWVHECERVLADRLINAADLAKFNDMRQKATKKFFAEIPQVICAMVTSPVWNHDSSVTGSHWPICTHRSKHQSLYTVGFKSQSSLVTPTPGLRVLKPLKPWG